MSRLIKFRAWDKHEKKMLNNPKLFEIIKVYDNQDDLLYRVGSNTYVDAECVQQFTGVHDKNGCEIYEGDIIQAFSTDILNDNFIGKVIYDPASFLIKISNEDIRGLWAGSDDTFSLLVIGNIYENPDLLK